MSKTDTSRNNEKVLLSRSKTMKTNKKNKLPPPPPSQKEDDKISISIYTNKYNKPIVESPKNSNAIIINQPIPTETAFTLEPAKLTCPYCKKQIISEVEENCNFCTCLLFFMAFAFCALPLLICSGIFNSMNCNCCNGDINCNCECCYDGIHRCTKCKKVIGLYESSPSFC